MSCRISQGCLLALGTWSATLLAPVWATVPPISETPPVAPQANHLAPTHPALAAQPLSTIAASVQTLVERYACPSAAKTTINPNDVTAADLTALLTHCASVITAQGTPADQLWVETLLAELAQTPTADSEAPTDSNRFPRITVSGEVTLEMGTAFAGQGNAYFDSAGNRIRLPRDFNSLPNFATSVSTGAQQTGSPFTTPTQLSGAINQAAINLTPANFPGAGAPGVTTLTDLSLAVANNLGLGAAGANSVLQGFINAGVNPNAGGTPQNVAALAGFHAAFASSLLSADGAKLVFVRPQSDTTFTLSPVARINLDTHFMDDDQLRLGFLVASNNRYASRTGVPEAELEVLDDKDSNDLVELSELYYRFPIGNAVAFVGLRGLEPEVLVPSTANLQDNTMAAFFDHNPLSYGYPSGAGVGLTVPLSDEVNLAAAFLFNDAALYGQQVRELRSDYGNTLFTQLTYTPSDRLTLALTYNHAFTPDYLGLESTLVPGLFFARQEGVSQDALAVNAAYEISPDFNISGWLGYEWAHSQSSSAAFNRFSWAVNLGFPNLFQPGNYGGLSFGVSPYVTQEQGRFLDSQNPPFLAQAFYRFRVTDHFSIQPGLLYVGNPTGNGNRQSVWLGSIQARFTF